MLARPRVRGISGGLALFSTFLSFKIPITIPMCYGGDCYRTGGAATLARSKLDQDLRASLEGVHQGTCQADLTMTQRFRIVEWTSTFKDGSRKVSYELLKQIGGRRGRWQQLGTSDTLSAARKALLFYTPNGGCWSS
jgi:hypothetical protein